MKKALIFLTFLSNFLFAQELKISEVVSSNLKSLNDEDGDKSDWIEVYNSSANAIQIGTYYLSDDINSILKWKLPTITLQANEFLVIFASDKNRIADTNYHTNFKLSKSGTYLSLINSANWSIDSITIPSLNEDISYGRTVDGSGTWKYFQQSTPKSSNQAAIAFDCLLKAPEIVVKSGKFSSPFQTQINNENEGATLKYSLSAANLETHGNLYSSSILIENVDLPNNFSSIPTNPSFTFPVGEYSEIRANTRGWLPPFSNQENIVNLSAQVFKENCISSPISYESYLFADVSNLPILSISVDSLDFFSDENGIYVFGADSLGNYSKSGIDWERKAKLDFFNKQNEVVFSEFAGLKISGHGSRHSTQKNLQIDFRNQYGKGELDTSLFQNSSLRKYESLSLRSGGHRPDCLPRDDYASNLFDKIEVDHAKYEFVKVYLNGEYWGIHALKERLNADYLSEKYHLEKDEIVILQNAGDVNDGTLQDSTDYAQLLNFVEENDLNLEQNYLHVDSLIDIQNFRDYLISEIFIGNADWPNSNIKFWRKRTPINENAALGHDGKWRWLLYDLDGAFGGTCNDVFYTFNTLNWSLQSSDNFEEYTKLIIALMNCDKFKNDFINRTCDLMNSNFKVALTREKLNAVFAQLDTEILKHVDRWRYPSNAVTLAERSMETPNLDKWNYIKVAMDSFLIQRQHYVRLHAKNLWNLSDSSILSLDVNDQMMGNIRINSLFLDENLEGTNQTVYPWKGTYFNNHEMKIVAIPKPGFRFVEWLNLGENSSELDISISSDTLFTALFEIDPNYVVPQNLKINEIMASNYFVHNDAFGDFDDWVEIYNPNAFPLDLKDYYISDDENFTTKYQFTNNLEIPAFGFQLIWCDEQVGQGVNHANFKLSSNGEKVILSSPNKEIIDQITFPELENTNSFGRSSDGEDDWITFDLPTPNYSNQRSELGENSAHKIQLFPNPSSEKIKFLLPKAVDFQVEISDLQGKIIIEKSINSIKNEIDIKDFKSGIYFVKVQNEQNCQIIKLVTN
jgi:hypothetical protein